MPRSVPALWLNDMLHCAVNDSRPCSSNSFLQKVRAKWPRSSSLRSRSMSQASCSGVFLKITAEPPVAAGGSRDHLELLLAGLHPVEVVVDLAGADEMLERL